jgi:hypothetical protein
MTVTTQQNKILTLVVGMFDAAAGAALLSSIEKLLASNADNYQALATTLGSTAIFKQLYPDTLDDNSFATQFFDNLVGSEVEDSVKAQGVSWFSQMLTDGASRTDAMLTTIITLNSISADHPDWGKAHQALVNQSAAAAYYSVETQQNGSDLAALQMAIASTTSDSSTVPTLPLALLLANYSAAVAAREQFSASADGDNDATTRATKESLDAELTAIFEKMDVVVEGNYASVSTVIQHAILADQVAKNQELADYYASVAVVVAAEVDNVAGLTAAKEARDTAVTEDKAAQQAVVDTNTVLLKALSDYGIANSTAVTVNSDGTIGNLIELSGASLALIAGVSEEKTAGIDALLVASIAKEAADELALQTKPKAEAATEVANSLDLDSAAQVVLAVLGSKFTKTTPAEVTAPTSAEINAEVTALAAEKTAGDTAATIYLAAVNLAKAADSNTNNTAGATHDLAAIKSAFIAVTGVSSADQNRITATVTDAAALIELETILAEKNTVFNDASTAVDSFNQFKSNYDTAANVNPVLEKLADAENKSTQAIQAITTLTALVELQTAAQLQVDKLAALEVDIEQTIAGFTGLSLAAPHNIDGTPSSTEGNDVFLANSVDGTISGFNEAGKDILYVGPQFTHNLASVAGENSGSALLELWLTETGGSTLITMETSALGANATDAETFVITLTGVALASVSLIDGFVTSV